MRLVAAVKPHRLPLLALVALLVAAAAPGRLSAQGKGKIDDVERSADDAKKKGSNSGDESGSGLIIEYVDDQGGGLAGLWRGVVDAFAWYPRDSGQGYLAYPYARPGSPETFVQRGVTSGRTFRTVSAAYFADEGSTLRAGHFAVEWTGAWLARTIEFSSYVERKANETDHLQMFRFSLAGLPPIGDIGYLRIGAGFQVVTVGGDAATGPEIELGAQLFPLRPFGVGAVARVAPLTWNGGPEWGLGFVDLAGSGSVFIGRVEVQAGYRWTRIGVGAPFKGPTLGLKVWF